MLTIKIQTVDVIVKFNTQDQHKSLKPVYEGLDPYVKWVKSEIHKKLSPYGFPVYMDDACAFDFLFAAQQHFGRSYVKADFKPEPLNIPN